MSNDSARTYGEVLWESRPWIFPSVLARTILLIVVAALIIWFEFYSGITYYKIANVQMILLTVLALLMIWVLSLTDLILLRASHKYILRNDSLEIKTGIVSLKQFIIVPAGFSHLETSQSILERVLGYGSIMIHSQSETAPDRIMKKVRNPSKIAEQIRYVMARTTVRTEK